MTRARLLHLPLMIALVSSPTLADDIVPADGEFVVNSYTTSNQGFPDVATNGNGTFVVTWETFEQIGPDFGVVAQRFDATGAAVGSELVVSTYTAGNQWDPTVAVAADGTFVVTWASFNQDGSDYGIFAQRFAADGSMAGGEFPVNTETNLEQNYPDIAIGNDGNFMIVWESGGQDMSFGGVYGQLFDSAGVAVGDEFRVNTTTVEDQDDAAITATPDGYVVVWESRGIDTSGDAVMMQRFDSDGMPIGGETQVNTSFSDDQEDPDIASLPDGTFAVVWESDGQDGSGETVVGQVFASDGSPIGGEMQINVSATGDQEDARIAAIGDDTFFVAWQGPGDSLDIFGRQFDADGNPVGAELVINTSTGDDQDVPAMAGDPAGRSIVAWRDFGANDGDAAGVLARPYDLALFFDGFESGNTLEWTTQFP